MQSKNYVLAIDQGTTSSRAIIFNQNLQIVAIAQQEFPQHFPQSGWVEHDPADIFNSTIQVCQQALAKAKLQSQQLAGIGITNQRETTLVWDKTTGQAIYKAIVWQDRRTSQYCNQLQKQGLQDMFQQKTGLLLDPYFSATKLRWILHNVPGALQKAQQGQLLFGTVDSYLIWKLSGEHVSDATNASRTMLYNIHDNCWDQDILKLLEIPPQMLPTVLDSADNFAHTKADFWGSRVPILGVAGDQQSAAIGQCCFQPGLAKSTYGTGCFMLLNTGSQAVLSKHKLISTIAYRLKNKTSYALEGSIFVAGSLVQWLRDGINIIDDAQQTAALAQSAEPDRNLYIIPAFTGLGAPYWDSQCRGAMFGLTRSTSRADIVRASLRAVCYQTRDLYQAMLADLKNMQQGSSTNMILRVDGKMATNDWLSQSLADIVQTVVERPKIVETTALGAAWLAGLQAGIYPSAEEFAASWELDQRFVPQMSAEDANKRYAGWLHNVQKILTTASD